MDAFREIQIKIWLLFIVCLKNYQFCRLRQRPKLYVNLRDIRSNGLKSNYKPKRLNFKFLQTIGRNELREYRNCFKSWKWRERERVNGKSKFLLESSLEIECTLSIVVCQLQQKNRPLFNSLALYKVEFPNYLFFSLFLSDPFQFNAISQIWDMHIILVGFHFIFPSLSLSLSSYFLSP